MSAVASSGTPKDLKDHCRGDNPQNLLTPPAPSESLKRWTGLPVDQSIKRDYHGFQSLILFKYIHIFGDRGRCISVKVYK